jgi:transcriptional regulator GlxA family with amidase domain
LSGCNLTGANLTSANLTGANLTGANLTGANLTIADLTGANDDCLRFFDELFLAPMSLTTVRQLARRLGVVPTTFMSRFFRAGIPAPKKYLATARLVRAARLLENPGYSLTQVAFLLEYSSPQSFSRHVTHSLHCGAAEFRKTYNGEAML